MNHTEPMILFFFFLNLIMKSFPFNKRDKLMVKHEHRAIIIQTLITVWNLRIFSFFLKYKKKVSSKKDKKIQVQHEES